MNKLNQTAVGVAMRDMLVGLLIFAVTASAQGQTGISDHKIRSVRVESLQALLSKQNVTIRTKANQKIKGRFLRTDAEVIEVTHRFKSTSTRLPLREVEAIEYRKVPAWMGWTAMALMLGGGFGMVAAQGSESAGPIGFGAFCWWSRAGHHRPDDPEDHDKNRLLDNSSVPRGQMGGALGQPDPSHRTPT
ncbi:MAG: hypothetical protein HS123_06150 [Solibacteraceae bacterium]|nr:hypothetical protein [Solibacteraceae bacterium]